MPYYQSFDLSWHIWRRPVTAEDGKMTSGAPEHFGNSGDSTDANYEERVFPAPTLTVESGVYTTGTKTFVESNSFRHYTPTARDVLTITGYDETEAGILTRSSLIASKTDDDTLVLASEIGKTLTNVDITITRERRTFDARLWSAIALRAFGTDAENETAYLQIVGWGDPNDPNTAHPGKGFVLWRGEATLGSESITRQPIKGWDTGTWFEVDTWTEVADAATLAGVNSCGAYEVSDGFNQSMLFLPTLGFPILTCEIYDLTDTGEMASCGVLAKGITRAGVV